MRYAKTTHVRSAPGLFVVCTVCIALVACRSKSEKAAPTHERREDRSVRVDGPSRAYVRTETVKAATGEGSRSLVARVSFDERQVARLGSPVTGRVAEIRVVTGDVVQKGAALATVRAVDIASSQAQLSDARTSRLQAEREAERAKRLVTEGAGSDAERQKAESALELARAEETRAGAALSAIGGAGGSATFVIKSPIAGTVVERNVAVGSQVTDSADKPLLTVADLSKVWVLADVYEQDLPFVEKGQPVVVRVLAFPERTFDGTLSYVSQVLDQATRSATARVELDNANGVFKPGMMARVEARGISRGTVTIPTSALLARRDQFFVFAKREDGSFEEREVTVAEQHGQHTTLLTGLRLGEEVVVEGAILLDAEANEAL